MVRFYSAQSFSAIVQYILVSNSYFHFQFGFKLPSPGARAQFRLKIVDTHSLKSEFIQFISVDICVFYNSKELCLLDLFLLKSLFCSYQQSVGMTYQIRFNSSEYFCICNSLLGASRIMCDHHCLSCKDTQLHIFFCHKMV